LSASWIWRVPLLTMADTFQCAAILFDLDGVLIDSTRSVARQWKQWALDNSIDPERVLAFAHGVRSIEVIRQMAPHLDAVKETSALEKREAADLDGVEVMPGAADLLKSIPAARWCVVTSGTRHLATSRLRLGNLPIPDVLVTADEVTNGKPHPEPYLKGAQLLGVDPKECVVIEDAPAGIRSAHAGRMKAIAITSTFPTEQLREADAVIGALSQLLLKVNGNDSLTIKVLESTRVVG
jgi:mannitol-1-/sugar-/sorbitol-6-phosphatase